MRKTLDKSKLYDRNAVEKLFDKYIKQGGEVTILDEGSLVYGLVVCHGDGLKTAVIKEVYLNEWISASSVRFYNKIPSKYQKMIDIIR